ncbi:FMN-binding negative transcriptional regulator [Marinihelvus fidelis]|uniref:FMN-binding negative transcriptional regulator n=1 Tax=Marinihelvus fidelis TaxID=2613842 RepID=A0A5N0TB11_9GAMM|nr:FMN-binding negative transcriptional regulator [Marinihelvus fidelis]KAA9130529.1 FMN-binding negative transcriptional regulator [Marinihelvus fidelis]
MYIPRHFKQHDHGAIVELMRSYPFATLVVLAGDNTSVNHVPLLVDDAGDRGLVLRGHVAHSNPIWRTDESRSCIAVFNGPNSYVSPSAYPTKKEHGRVVPTWNYTAVHASGAIEFIHDARWKTTFLESLTNEHEAAQSEPWSLDDAPEDFIHRLLGAIVGFEIRVESIEGKWKLSQNQPAKNYNGVVEALSRDESESAQEIARLMRNGPSGR